MIINNQTTVHQVMELMGPEADEIDGVNALYIMLEEGITDTNDCDFDEVMAQAAFRREIQTPR